MPSSRGGAIRENSPDPQYLDAFLQGARFALLAIEGRMNEGNHSPSPELARTLGDFHDLFSSTRQGLESREVSLELAEHYLGKN